MRARRASGLRLATAFASYLAAAALPLPTGEWSCLESPHVKVYTDVSPDRLSELTTDLGRLDEVLARTTAGLRGRHARPAIMFAFKKHDTFERYSANQPNVAGLFFPGEEAHYLLVDFSAQNVPTETAQHEWIHLVLHDALPRLPQWFHEGFAEYYSTFESEGNRAEIGKAIGHHVRLLAGSTNYFPVSKLLRIESSDAEYWQEGFKDRFYAESWLLAHMLLQAPDSTLGDVNRYLTLLRRGASEDSAATIAFPALAGGALDARLQAYARDGKFTYSKWTFDAAMPSPRPTVRAASRVEVLDALAELLRVEGSGFHAAAAAHWDEARRADPAFAAAPAGLGRLAEYRGDRAAADGFYRQALAIDSTDAPTLYRVAAGRIERAQGDLVKTQSGWSEARQPGRRVAADLLDRVLAARPEDDVAEGLFASACLGDPDDSPRGLMAAASAIEAFPYRADLWETYALLYAQSGATSQARKIVRTNLHPLVEPAQESYVYWRIGMVDWKHAQRALVEGRAVEADSILERAARETDLLRSREEIMGWRVDFMVDHAAHLSSAGRKDQARAILARFDDAVLTLEQRKRVEEGLAALGPAKKTATAKR